MKIRQSIVQEIILVGDVVEYQAASKFGMDNGYTFDRMNYHPTPDGESLDKNRFVIKAHKVLSKMPEMELDL
jgi:methionine salvage enolase-phosphatase E1